MAAFAHQLSCLNDADAYFVSQQADFKFAEQSFVSVGLFEAPFGEGAPATAMMSGRVLDVAERRGPTGEGSLLWLLVDALPGRVDVVCDPRVLTGTPVRGGLVSGFFWLSGQPRALADPEVEPGPACRRRIAAPGRAWPFRRSPPSPHTGGCRRASLGSLSRMVGRAETAPMLTPLVTHISRSGPSPHAPTLVGSPTDGGARRRALTLTRTQLPCSGERRRSTTLLRSTLVGAR